MLFSSALWLSMASIIAAQSIAPSNDTSDISDPRTSPRFWINSTVVKQKDKFPGFVVAPLAQYAQISRNVFLSIAFEGVLVNTNRSNAEQVQSNDFNFVSCDPEDYEGGAADVNAILNIITSQQSSNTRDKSSLIFYSTRSNHCNASNIAGLDLINGVFTTLDPVVAAQVASNNFTEQDKIAALLSPDRSSYVPYGTSPGASATPGAPTTAIAMIILYSITGIITAMFIVIIIVGAVRAHRHPERYGPRNMMGRPRQSRAKGIARAMLETLPIVKFGDHHDLATGAVKSDTELGAVKTVDATGSKDTADKSVATTTTTPVKPLTTSPENSETITGASNADGTDDAGSLGCSICTEDFQKGEEVRVLPCNHKFHPDCVDPWLLNVSGTCPLCRISLATGETEEGQPDGENIAPPLDPNPQSTDRRSQVHSLMAIAYGSREERVAALRRYRAERRNRTINDEERLSRTRRFREAFRIRTRRHETNAVEQDLRSSGIDAIAAPQTRM